MSRYDFFFFNNFQFFIHNLELFFLLFALEKLQTHISALSHENHLKQISIQWRKFETIVDLSRKTLFMYDFISPFTIHSDFDWLSVYRSTPNSRCMTFFFFLFFSTTLSLWIVCRMTFTLFRHEFYLRQSELLRCSFLTDKRMSYDFHSIGSFWLFFLQLSERLSTIFTAFERVFISRIAKFPFVVSLAQMVRCWSYQT